MTDDGLTAPYQAYLERAAHHLGDVQDGAYAKFRGRLIKKLPFDEFGQRWQRFQQLRDAYQRSMDRGDTVNDAVQQLLDELSAELLVDPLA